MISEQNVSARRLELYEVLEKIENTQEKEKQIEILRENKTPALVDYCRCLYDDRVNFNLPEGPPPYTPSPEESYPSTWHRENRKLRYVVKGLQGDQLTPLKRETIFIGILEAVHPKDAEVIIKMKDKQPAAEVFTYDLVKEAFPDVFAA